MLPSPEQNRKTAIAAARLLAAASALMCPHGLAGAATLTTVATFHGTNGNSPQASLLEDSSGNLFGDASVGGINGDGTVFMLSPRGLDKTKWTKYALKSFDSVKSGANPRSRLIADAVGNLYGTTSYGGTEAHGFGSDGTVFRLSPPAAGKADWTTSILTSFTIPSRGQFPAGGLVADAAGNLFGVTNGGGSQHGCRPYGCGTIYRLAPSTQRRNRWVRDVLFLFSRGDGSNPYGGLAIDSAGNLYGTTLRGGGGKNCSVGCGTVFRLSPPAAGQTDWRLTKLASFDNTDRAGPAGDLLLGHDGSLYGTTQQGGASGRGTVFRVSPPGAARAGWTKETLIAFDGTYGGQPESGVIQGADGNLYGTAVNGGTAGAGTVFRLSPPSNGASGWVPTLLVSFNGTNGRYPFGGLIEDNAGNFYGATSAGGEAPACAYECGTIFRLTQ